MLHKIVITTNRFRFIPEEISIPDVGSFGFVSANITSVSTPPGMSYSCDPEELTLENAWICYS